jgi:hypothetical protein
MNLYNQKKLGSLPPETQNFFDHQPEAISQLI